MTTPLQVPPSFLFSAGARKSFVQCCCCGVSRAVHFVQEQDARVPPLRRMINEAEAAANAALMSGGASERKITALFEEVERLQERLARIQRENIGTLTSAIGRVRRQALLQDAMALMEAYVAR